MKLKLVSLLFVAVGVAYGQGVCPPNFAVDAQPLTISCQGLGVVVRAIPNSVWLVGWNDNPGNYAPYKDGLATKICTPTPGGGCDDFDFNDVVEMIICNYLGTECQVFFVNPFSGWNDSVWYAGQPLFYNDVVEPTPKVIHTTPYMEVDLYIRTPEGDEYHQGNEIENSDNAVHAWVQQIGTLPPVTVWP